MAHHLTDLRVIPLMPTFTSSSNLKEIAFKTIPSASKLEIKSLLESFYGFEVQKVRTLIMKGKKKKLFGSLVAKPDYKKAYVTLKKPLSFSDGLFQSRTVANKFEENNNKKMLTYQ